MQSSIKNNYIKQILMLILILFLVIVVLWKLKYFIPGALGAITLYIVLRKRYFRLVEDRGWKPWVASLLIIICLILTLALPIYGLIAILSPMFTDFLSNTDAIKASVLSTIDYINQKVPQANLSTDNILEYLQQWLTLIPTFLASTASVFANIFTALFILYFMLIKGRNLEQSVRENIPLYRKNRNELWEETRVLIVSNALGIPFLAVCQGLVALLGYWIFDVPHAALWALMTGLATVIPVVGTMVIWVPICIYLLSVGQVGNAVGTAIYCLIAVGGIDNVLRLLFVKKFGDVHPLITIFGVLLGLEIFGIMGLIFGPLLLAYVILLIKIYKVEFGNGDLVGDAAPPLTTLPFPENVHELEINPTEDDILENDGNPNNDDNPLVK